MRPQWTLALVAIACWSGHAYAQNNVNETAMKELSSCVMQCSEQILSRFDCTPQQSCFCDNPRLQDDMQACMMSTGCPFADQLAAKKFQTTTCNVPIRDRGPLLAILAYTLFGVAAVFTFLRILSRWPKAKGAGSWDDAIAIICLAPLTAMTAGDYFAISYGKGKDIWGLTPEDVKNFTMWFYICNNQYNFVIFGTKISLVLLYLRIWHARDTFRSLCWITLGLLVSALIAFQVVVIIQCLPIASQWQRFVDPSAQGTCINREMWVWALAGAETGFDVLVILLPIPKLLTLKISWTRKLGVSSVFLVGFTVTAMSIVRLFYIHGFTTNPNFTYYFSYIGLYSSIEAYLSQVACCMPATAGLIRRCYQKTSDRMPRSNFRNSSVHEPGTPFRSASQEPTIESTHIFDISTQDMEKGQADDDHMDEYPANVKASNDYSSTDDSAISPVVQRQSHQSHQVHSRRSFEQSWRPQSKRKRETVGTENTNTISSSWRTPDILYHDKQNQLRLEIHDPPREPVKATLTYLDRFDGKHDVELQGRPQTSSDHRSRSKSSDASTRPSTSPSSSYSSDDNIPFAGRKNLIRAQQSQNRIDQLLQAHKTLTEGGKVEDVRASLGMGSKKSRESKVEDEIML